MNFNTLYLFFIFSILVILNNVLHILSQTTASGPDTSYVLACGASTDAEDTNGRIWKSDSQFLLNSGISMTLSAHVQDPSLPSIIPYMTARIFTSTSTYKILVAKGKRFWLRLHFYPTSYGNLDPSKSYFDVIANGFTLLQNFSASRTAQALTQVYFMKEFALIPTQSSDLNITFKPNLEHIKDAYAFVNGIEVISMPDIFAPAPLVGYSDQFVEVDRSSFQTIARLNVGGQFIPPTHDSGSARTWYDDSSYIFGAAFGVTFKADESVKIQYPGSSSKEIAPLDVYNTARSMGPHGNININYNLTWIFQIDANFTYLVRFHFCELEFEKVNQRVFQIFVNNQTAEENADMIAWAKSRGVPVYRDYAVYCRDVPGDEELWVALHPSPSTRPQYYDAILNGLEIFKMNDTRGNLAGPNPVPSPMPTQADDAVEKYRPSRSKRAAHLIGGIIGGVVGCSVVVGFFICFTKEKRKGYRSTSSVGYKLPLYRRSHTSTSNSTTSSGKSIASSHLSSVAAGLCRHFSLLEIKHCTENFSESQVIGVGGFGKVYEGLLDGNTKVAIKRSNPSSDQGCEEFLTEIEMLSRLRHKHLVSLIGFCEEDGEMILVYDYMANGALREQLYRSNNPALSWKQRLAICIGAARGLHYLHTGAWYTIIHRDVKTTNILLDEKWVAKVSDFGLSKMGSNPNQTHVSTIVKGSFGYLDPEYFRRQQLTEKSDVYSFGVVLFEVLCARPALDPSLPMEQVSLVDWALHCMRKGTLEDIIDPNLKGQINPLCLRKFTETAEKCVAEDGLDRPTMGAVLWNLEFALQLEKTSEQPELVSCNSANDTYAMYTAMLGIDEDSIVSLDNNAPNGSNIFSPMVNPGPR